MEKNYNHFSFPGTPGSDPHKPQERDFFLRSPEMAETADHFSDGFSVYRTINGIPVSGNDFLLNCSIEDSDALRILLAARHRAAGSAASGIFGGSQITH